MITTTGVSLKKKKGNILIKSGNMIAPFIFSLMMRRPTSIAGKAKHELGLTREAELDLHTALRLATQKGYVRLKNSIEETLRDLQ